MRTNLTSIKIQISCPFKSFKCIFQNRIIFEEYFQFNFISTGRRIPITLPNTGALARKRNSFYLRAILVICLILFAGLQIVLINSRNYQSS